MEFPNIGEHCVLEDCKQLDYLPVKCDHCQLTFCKIHFKAESHKCTKVASNFTSSTEKSLNFVCSKPDCKEMSPIEILCYNCKNHFCIKHRYHGCLEISNDETLKKLKKWQIPKKQFAHAKAIVDQEVADSLKKSKNTAMANKVQLMRVKSNAVGPKNIPMDERCYFLVYPPASVVSKVTTAPKGIYINKHWTVGKIIDSMADILKIPNNNNLSNTNKLHLFHYNTGKSICNKMDTPIIELFENSVLIDGQCIILEYSDNTAVDFTLYK